LGKRNALCGQVIELYHAVFLVCGQAYTDESIKNFGAAPWVVGSEKHAYTWSANISVCNCSHQLRNSGVIASICIPLACENGWPWRIGGERKRGGIGHDFLFMVGSTDELDSESISVRSGISERLSKIFRCTENIISLYLKFRIGPRKGMWAHRRR
jgi:hypothetical protein